ncbi:MAG: response regulator [Leeuwenhoekiella sp.]
MRQVLFLLLSLLSVLCRGQDYEGFIPDLEASYEKAENFLDQGDYAKAIDQAVVLIRNADSLSNNYYLFDGYYFLSLTYSKVNDSIKAMEHSKKALRYAKMTNDDEILLIAHNNLASDLSLFADHHDESVRHFKKAAQIEEKLGKQKLALLNIAQIYADQKEYRKMYNYLEQAESSLDSCKPQYNGYRFLANYLYGKYYHGLENYAFAHKNYELANKAVTKADSLRNNPEFYKDYATFLFDSGQDSLAYLNYQKYHKYLTGQERKKYENSLQLAGIRAEVEEMRREFEKVDYERKLSIEQLDRQRIQFIFIVIIGIVLILTLLYYLKERKKRKKYIDALRKKNGSLRMAKVSVEKSVEAKTKFFSTLSHEMRTPLYGVTGIISYLEKQDNLDEYSEELESLKFSADHLLAIINDLLDISKLEDKRFTLTEEPFNLKNTLKEIVHSFDRTAALGTNKIYLNFDERIPYRVVGDVKRVSQIILNILGNAVKFTDDGEIYLRALLVERSEAGCNVHFEIEDTGIGIGTGKLSAIFDEFSQIDSLRPNMQNGTGLGLSIVKRILKAMGSTIQVESEEGKGSKFMFDLTFKPTFDMDEDAAQTLAAQVDLDSKELFAHKRFMIVDDNRINRMVTKKIIQGKQGTVEQAEGGEQAIKILKDHSCDLIFMDINMPGLNGFETTKRLREMGIKTPIIALTAANTEDMIESIYGSGMNGYVIKPYITDDFIKLILNHLQSKTNVATA